MGGLLAILSAGSPLAAQQQAPVDLGLVVVHYTADGITRLSPWGRLAFEDDTPARRLRAGATLLASPLSASGSADAAGWWRRALGDAFTGEAGGEASAVYGLDAHTSTALLGGLRIAHTLGDAAGVALRVTAHVAGREAGALRGHGADLAAWYRLPSTTLTATVAREETQGQLFVGPRGTQPVGVVPVRYTELSLGSTTARPWGTVAIAAGARRDPDARQRTEATWSASVVAWARPGRGLTLSVGTQPDDFVRGAEATQWVSVGLRLEGRGSSATPRARAGPVVLVADTTRRLRVLAPGAERVELMADFTNWDAVPLERDADAFVLPVPLTPGTHRLMLRVDGGPWRAPANLPSMDDDFGGRVGVLAVP